MLTSLGPYVVLMLTSLGPSVLFVPQGCTAVLSAGEARCRMCQASLVL